MVGRGDPTTTEVSDRDVTAPVHQSRPTGVPYLEVPAADVDAVIDPHWLELRGSSPLPATYMPPSMPGPSRPWQRFVAVALAAMFLGATAAGVCLTYGPPLPGLW